MPGPLRARGFVPPQTDLDWVRDGLASLGSICEWPSCRFPAAFVHEGRTSIAYLCETHVSIPVRWPDQSKWLDAEMWEWFRDLYDMILQAEKSGGELFRAIEGRDAAIVTESERVIKETRKLEREAVAIVRNDLRKGRVGVPDDELIDLRGAQSPPREEDRFIFRVPELLPPSPVTLPEFARREPLLLVELM